MNMTNSCSYTCTHFKVPIAEILIVLKITVIRVLLDYNQPVPFSIELVRSIPLWMVMPSRLGKCLLDLRGSDTLPFCVWACIGRKVQ